ncbi:MAG: MotA/TolQ/ExbB proton channel family protein [Phycisphaeraceae bacterium]
MRRVLFGLVMMAAFLLSATPVFAQSSSGGQSMSYFKMFFWSDDTLGLIITWFIILMSAVNMGASIHFFIKYRRTTIIPEMTYVQLEAMLDEKRYRDAIDFAANDPSFLARLVDAGLNEASNGYAAMERAVEEASDAESTKLLRPVEFLNVLGNVAPMCGLFGTVYGMIVAFSKLVESGGKPDPAKLAGGISTALVTTFWGLVVAIPALSAYAWIRNKIDALCAEGMVMAEELISPFKPGGKKEKPGGKPGAPGAPGGPAAPGRPTPKPTKG